MFIKRFLELPKDSCFLFGPRGTGKTTFLKQSLTTTLSLDLLNPAVRRIYISNPEHLAEEVRALPDQSDIIIDEVQRVPELLTVVHALIEEHRGWRFVMSGSSARKLRRAGVDLLGGRALRVHMHPFILAEVVEYPFEQAIRYGLLPKVYGSGDRQATLDAYISLYMEEEVYQEALVRNIGDFGRFLSAISLSHGQLLNISYVARDCHVKRKTVESYVQILEDILLGYKLEVFRRRALREVTSHPKFYLFDSGVFQTLRPKGPLDSPSELGGSALEGLVLQHLRAWNDYRKSRYNIHFWRSRNGLEVDFVLYGEEGFFAIEVKNSKVIMPRDLRSLDEFKKDYPEARCILLHIGDQKFLRKDIICLPCEAFLRRLSPEYSLADLV